MAKVMVLMNHYTAGQLDARQAAVLAAAAPGTEVGFGEVSESPGGGATTNFHRAVVAPLFARKAQEAEEAGYGAVLPWGTLDLGVEEARHVVRIPVIGPGRTSVNVAASLVDRFGVMVYGADQVVMFRKLVHSWGAGGRLTSIGHVGMRPMEIAEQVEEARRRFVAESRRLVDESGAELILPLGFSLVPVALAAGDLADEIEAPVLDPLAIVMHVAEALASSGYRNSRIAYPEATLS